MKLKIILIGLMALIISFQIFALTKTVHYKTGEVRVVQEYVNGKDTKTTIYHKTGEVKQVVEYVNGKKSKITFYNKTGEV
jgi:antitoxin component YwqK of YwqJK toxin-antitoxin module